VIGYKFYIVFIASTVTLWWLVYIFFPETAGLSLEEMAKVFGDEVVSDFTEEYLVHQRRQSVAGTVGASGGEMEYTGVEKVAVATESEHAV
jgi:hypothetical protein